MNGVIREFHLSRPDSSKDITTLLDENCRGVYSQANICVCTTHADEALTNMLASLKQSGRTPILFLVLSEGLTERERDNRMAKLRPLQYSNIACRVISQAAELQVGL